MSRTVSGAGIRIVNYLIIGSSGTGKSRFSSLSLRLKDVLGDLNRRTDSIISHRNSIVLDVMRKGDCILACDFNGRYLAEFVDRERFPWRFTQNEVGYGMAVRPYLPAHICIYGIIEKLSFSLELCCLKKDDMSFGKDATEKQSNELLDYSLPMAVHLWRDKRHRRKRTCDFRSVPWKLNSDWDFDNAEGRDIPRCA